MTTNDWRSITDRFFSQEPTDPHFDKWLDKVIEKLSQEFYDANEDWIMQPQGQCNDWLVKLYDNYKNPLEASAILQRARQRYRESE